MSVDKYLYAGEIRQKTHFKSKETHSSIQGKRRRPIRARHSTSHGSKGPLSYTTDLGKSHSTWIRQEGPATSHPAKDGPIRGRPMVGRPPRSAGRPTPPTDLRLRCGSSPLVLEVSSRRHPPSAHPPSAHPPNEDIHQVLIQASSLV